MSKIVQITSGDAYYFDKARGQHTKHNTLFALDSEGRIWTRYYDGEMYREWYTLQLPGVPEQTSLFSAKEQA